MLVLGVEETKSVLVGGLFRGGPSTKRESDLSGLKLAGGPRLNVTCRDYDNRAAR